MRQSLFNERKKFDLLDFVVSLCLFICMHMHLRINLYNFSSSKLPHCSSIYMFTHCLPVCNQTVLIITLLGPGSTSSCTDKVNCAQYGTSFCSDPSYTAFTQEKLQYVLRYWYHLARQTCCAFYVRHRYSFSSCLLSKTQLRSWPFYLPASSVFIHTVWSFDFRWNRNGWVLQINVQEKNVDVENWLLVLVLSWH